MLRMCILFIIPVTVLLIRLISTLAILVGMASPGSGGPPPGAPSPSAIPASPAPRTPPPHTPPPPAMDSPASGWIHARKEKSTPKGVGPKQHGVPY
eukprot:5670425-Pyramimonas_sp.AAC.1